MIFKILILISLVSLSDSFRISGIPFNLPNTRYCSSCDMLQAEWPNSTQPIGIDGVCLHYLKSAVKLKWNNSKLLFSMLQSLLEISHEYAWLLFSYLKAKSLYEIAYNETYTYQIFVVPSNTLTSNNCIQIFEHGGGFNNRSYIGVGGAWERVFAAGVRDVWASHHCNDFFHREFALAAQRRVLHQRRLSLSWNMQNMQMGQDLGFPTFTEKFVRPCGTNGVPTSLVPDLTKCSDLYCEIDLCTDYSAPITTPATPNAPPLPRPKTGKVSSASTVTSSSSKETTAKQQIVINEFFPCSRSRNTPGYEFIELRVEPTSPFPVTMTLLKLVAFSMISKKLLMVATLNNQRFNSEGYFVVEPTYRYLQHVTEPSIENQKFDVLPCSDEEAIVILLLRRQEIPQVQWEGISLIRKGVKSHKSRDLNEVVQSGGETVNLLDVFKRTVIDAQVYGNSLNTEVPVDVRDILSHTGTSCNFILPLPDPAAPDHLDLTFNYCPENEDHIATFEYRRFKHGKRTIGMKNECSHSWNYLTERLEQSFEFNTDVGLTDQPKNVLECPSDNPKIGKVIEKIEMEIEYIRTNFDKNYESTFYPQIKFTEQVWPKIEFYGFVNLFALKELTPFEVINQPFPIADVTVESGSNALSIAEEQLPDVPIERQKVRCRVCYRHLLSCRDAMNKYYRQVALSQKEGVQVPTMTSTAKSMLDGHVNTLGHLEAVFYSIQTDGIFKAANCRAPHLQADTEYQSLANIFDIVYTFVRTNTAPNEAEAWYGTLKKIEANIGEKLHSRGTMYRMIDFIAVESHDRAIKYLLSTNAEFSIILDGSSDRKNNHYVLVYFQVLEGEITLPLFMYMLKLEKHFTAKDYLDELWGAIDKTDNLNPGFKKFVQDKVVALITDSASVMQRLHKLFNEKLDRVDASGEPFSIVEMYCLAHKLQLATRNAIVPLIRDQDKGENDCLKYFLQVEKFMQTTYVWFKSAGRRIGELREATQAEGQPRIELKQLHAERWISSEYSTVTNFLATWMSAISALTEISEDNSQPLEVRSEAVNIRENYNDKTLLITIKFLQDFTATFKVWSLFLQKYSGMIINQYPYYKKVLGQMEVLESFSSPAMEQFLLHCTCEDSETCKEGCTVDEYIDCSEILWRGISLRETDTNAPNVKILVAAIMKKVKTNFDKYLPKNLIEAAQALNPASFPPGAKSLNTQHPQLQHDYEDNVRHENNDMVVSNENENEENGGNRIYAEEKIRTLAVIFGIEDSVVQDWARFIRVLLKSEGWKTYRVIMDANLFWAAILKDNHLPWTTNLRQLIRSAKVLAPGSVVCESGFSLFNIVKNQRRSSISDEHIEALLRILTNGPSNINEFDSKRYADRWKQTLHQSAEDEVVFKAQCQTKATPDFTEDDVTAEEEKEIPLTFDTNQRGDDYYYKLTSSEEKKQPTIPKTDQKINNQDRPRSRLL